MATLFNDVTDDELYTSYLNYLPEKGAHFILSFKDRASANKQAIIDIFSESNIFVSPTPENIKELSCRAANITLIQCPSYAMQSLLKVVGPFWKEVTKEMFQGYLEEVTPTTLDPEETCPIDQKLPPGYIITYEHAIKKMFSFLFTL